VLAEAGDTLFATFIGTKQYKDIIADVNILQGTVFHEDTAQDLADAVECVQNDDQKGEENLGTSYREKSKQLRKSKPAAHRVRNKCNYLLNIGSLLLLISFLELIYHCLDLPKSV
jgi:hypothetical protein